MLSGSVYVSLLQSSVTSLSKIKTPYGVLLWLFTALIVLINSTEKISADRIGITC